MALRVKYVLPLVVALVLSFVPACSSSGNGSGGGCDEMFSTLQGSRDLLRTLVLRAQESDSPEGSEITAEEQAEIDPIDAQVTEDYDAWVAAGCNT